MEKRILEFNYLSPKELDKLINTNEGHKRLSEIPNILIQLHKEHGDYEDDIELLFDLLDYLSSKDQLDTYMLIAIMSDFDNLLALAEGRED